MSLFPEIKKLKDKLLFCSCGIFWSYSHVVLAIHVCLFFSVTLLSKEKDNIETELKVQREQAEKKVYIVVLNM